MPSGVPAEIWDKVNIRDLPLNISYTFPNKTEGDEIAMIGNQNFQPSVGLVLSVGNETGQEIEVTVDGVPYSILSSEKSVILNNVPYNHVKITNINGGTANKVYIAVQGIQVTTLQKLAGQKIMENVLG